MLLYDIRDRRDPEVQVTSRGFLQLLTPHPSNLLGKHLGMGRWLAGCAFGFGIRCMCSAFVRNFAEFCFVRALLGVFEGGVLTGIAMGLVLTSSNIGAAFGGLIASGILKIDHIGWLRIWRNIFLIEGLITTVVAICVFFLVIDSPLQARWLTEEEKILAVGRLESGYPAINEAAQHTRKQTIRQGLLNINASTWLIAIGFLFITAVFFPTGIATLFPEKTPVAKQLLSVPPYLMAAVMQIIIPWGIISTWTYVNADAPDYRKGNTLNLAGMIIALVLTVVTMICMKWENAQRARGARDHHLDGLTPAEEAQLGHLHPKFRYKL
ncbi:major facilitator superfamily domain-containing protein [Mycena vulgaris]|nr:major facilitator superfamily domain-containing protein [Mycena vulgaris]